MPGFGAAALAAVGVIVGGPIGWTALILGAFLFAGTEF